MKVCFVTHEGVTLAKGGIYVKIMEFKKYFESQGVEVELFNMWESTSRLAEFEIVHLINTQLATYGIARNLFNSSVPFVAEPVVFSNNSTSFIKLICNLDSIIKKSFRGMWFDYGFIKDICGWAKLVLPNTETEAELLQKGFGINKSKIRISHNGVSGRFADGDPSLFKKKYGIENFILNVGHVGPYRKNILALVKALSAIDHPAVIIGKISQYGETDAVMREAAKNKNLLILEDIPNNSPMLASAYAACSTFVLPSIYETPGIAALEAALAGAKIVITENGGTKDYFANYAEYVNPKSVDSIKEKIILSLNSLGNPEMKAHIQKNFLWKKVAENTLQIYREIIAR